MTCRITLLNSAKLTSLTKTFCGPDLDVQPFKIGKDFVIGEEPVSDLKSLANLLQRLENEPTQAIIRGSLIAGKKTMYLATKRPLPLLPANGAIVEQIHIDADNSENGKLQSLGCMVNYLYDLEQVTKNHEDFVSEGKVIASKEIEKLAKAVEL